jgi:uncharacterized protein (TIGR01777 family)
MNSHPTILITGGTGLIGSALTNFLIEKGHGVIILTRKKDSTKKKDGVEYAEWDLEKQFIEPWAIQRADHIIHLTGANVGEKRWTAKRKNEIVESRTLSSELLVKCLREIQNNVLTVVSASGIGWYGEDGDKRIPFVEDDPPAKGFLGETCKAWEESIEPVRHLGKRLVKVRIGLVLSKDGGILEEFKKPLRFGLATILGSGKQIMSWIHMNDLCRLFYYVLEHQQLHGAYNAVAPQPESNRTLVNELAKRVRGNFFIPVYVPVFALKLALGEMSVEILKSTTVSNQKMRQAGFRYLYPSLGPALDELVKPSKVGA